MRLLACLLLMVFVITSHAETTALQLSQLAAKEPLAGFFKQRKELKGISFPLHSSGQFNYIPDVGIYNETNKPLFQALSFSSKGIMEWDRSGELLSKKGKQSRAEKLVAQLLLAIFQGSEEEVGKLFELQLKPLSSNDSLNETSGKTSEKNDGQLAWELQLTPRNFLVKEHVSFIRAQGDQYISQIVVAMANGDRTRISFIDIKVLDKDEAVKQCSRFEPKLGTLCDKS